MRNHKKRCCRLLLLALLAMGYGTVASAASLSFSVDGGPVTICGDGAPCDINSNAGVVTFTGSFGPFAVNVTTGVTKPVYPGSHMSLSSVNMQVADAGSHTLVMMFSETGFGEMADFVMEFGGTLTDNGSTITATGYFDAANALFHPGTLIGSTGPLAGMAFDRSFTGSGSGSTTYSLTQVLTLNTTGPTNFSGNFELQTVPEPASMTVLGGALLLAMGVVVRRKSQWVSAASGSSRRYSSDARRGERTVE